MHVLPKFGAQAKKPRGITPEELARLRDVYPLVQRLDRATNGPDEANSMDSFSNLFADALYPRQQGVYLMADEVTREPVSEKDRSVLQRLGQLLAEAGFHVAAKTQPQNLQVVAQAAQDAGAHTIGYFIGNPPKKSPFIEQIDMCDEESLWQQRAEKLGVVAHGTGLGRIEQEENLLETIHARLFRLNSTTFLPVRKVLPLLNRNDFYREHLKPFLESRKAPATMMAMLRVVETPEEMVKILKNKSIPYTHSNY